MVLNVLKEWLPCSFLDSQLVSYLIFVEGIVQKGREELCLKMIEKKVKKMKLATGSSQH